MILLALTYILASHSIAISMASHENSWIVEESKRKKWQNLYHFFKVVGIFFYISPVVWFDLGLMPWYDWYWYLIIAALSNLFYDYTRNAVRIGVSITHRGSSGWDSVLKKFGIPESWFVMVRLIVVVLAFTFSFRFWKDKK